MGYYLTHGATHLLLQQPRHLYNTMGNSDEMPTECIWRYDNTSDNSCAMRFDEGYGLIMEVTGNSLEKVVERTINASIDGTREVWLT